MLNLLRPEKKIKIIYDLNKPNGNHKKELDISIAKKNGWKQKYDIKKNTIKKYKDIIKGKKRRKKL